MSPPRPRPRPRRRLILAALVFLLLVFSGRACVFRPAAAHPGAHFNRGENAAWIGIEWVNEPHTSEQIAQLAADLRARQIRHAYLYVSYLRRNGAFGETYAHASTLTTALRAAAPEIQLHAWIGVPLASTSPFSYPGFGYVDLADPAARRTITAFSAQLLRDAGFHGIHLNAEVIESGNPHVLVLLDETRAAIGPRATLSIATHRIRPVLPDLQLPRLGVVAWEGAYYREVARRVDQIALMTYDSGIPWPSLYRYWTRFQVIHLSRALSGTGVQLFIGVPTSREHTRSHDPAGENMLSGLLGTIDGLNDAASVPSAVTGVAIYPYWETTEADWRTYAQLWLGRSSPEWKSLP